MSNSKVLLLGFLAILAIEYLGITSHYVLILHKIKFPLIFTACLCLYAIAKYGVRDLFAATQVKTLLAFIFLTGLAMFHGLIQSYAVQPFKQQLGYLMLVIIGFHALKTIKAFNLFAAVMVAIHAALAVINFEKFQQAERVGGFKAGYFVGDGNDFGWSMTITFAWAMYLLVAGKGLVWRLIGLSGGVFVAVGVIGTQSRGATLALVAALLYFWVVISKRKMLGLIGLMVIGLAVLVLAPENYFSRMQTLSTYEEDTSATNRLLMWGKSIEMAFDHPLLGVGAGSFNSAYGRYYRGGDDPTKWLSTHSVYFKVLAEYSFLGIGLFLGTILLNVRENRRTSRHLKELGQTAPFAAAVPEFANMAIVAYSVAATFLTGVNYPHLYILTAVTLALKGMAYSKPADGQPASDASQDARKTS
ncbi:MAG: O-antigen ligase family protein [Planctomycetes bacterium]|nr:O-antigen ligase family protein [Planctomycetota bacterium]